MIRKMHEADLEVVANIDEQCFSVPWSKEQYIYEFTENDYAYILVLESEDGIIGFIDFWITFETCQLAKIAVLPKFRKNHHAHELMCAMIRYVENNDCENISLEVRVSNIAAQKLYESFGFIKVNQRKNYYQDNGEDAIVLVKALGGYRE